MTARAAGARLGLILACAAGATVAGHQVFRGRTDLVMLNVTVLDAAGHLVPGLSREDFQVLEDGVLQDITNFARDPQPISLAVLLDSSVSMEAKLKTAQEAAIGFAKRLTPKDLAEIIDFDTSAQILQTFTANVDLLERAIRRTEAGGSTALYNALYVAFGEFKRERARAVDDVRRQAVVILSDGEDTSSVVPVDLVLDEAKRADVMTFAIGLRPRTGVPNRGWNEAEFFLKTIAQETGGRTYFVEDVKDLAAMYDQVALELANQYTIGYVSKNGKRDGTWRKVMVQVGRPDTLARTKAGYFAPSTPR
jgi:Ca-activated chloride channel family protein